VSSRHTRSFFGVILAVVFALSAVVVAPASAKLTKHQKAHIRKQLKRAIHKNPRLIKSKRFIKKASLVDFTLPVTIKLRDSSKVNPLTGATLNPNNATIDLGASLGQREIDLGGSLAAEIQFHDSFDGGALGNVDLAILPSASKALTSTSIPLLWNKQVSTGLWDSSITGNGGAVGCGNFTNAAATSTSLVPAIAGGPYLPVHVVTAGGPVTAPGFPTTNHTTGAPTGDYVGVFPGIDDISKLTASKIPGHNDNLGGNPNPFPAAPDGPTNSQANGVQDTVLRTTALRLTVPAAGTSVNPTTNPTGPDNTQNIVIGKSGGQANLFGDIPGKSYGIDVTVSLATKINSIIRAVDADPQHLDEGQPWPAALFNCRQAVTGYTQNYIHDVKLQGHLKISPAITPSGDLRIAKATLSSLDPTHPAQVALAACLSPYSALAAQQHSTDTAHYPVPTGPSGPYSTPLSATAFLLPAADQPADTHNRRDSGNATDVPQDPSDNTNSLGAAGECNSTQTTLTQDAGLSGLVDPTDPAYSTSSDGSKVSVSGDLTVNDVEADVLIGDRP